MNRDRPSNLSPLTSTPLRVHRRAWSGLLRASLGTLGVSLMFGCGGQDDAMIVTDSVASASVGCTGVQYPNVAASPYVLPWPVGQSARTGLTNCAGMHKGQADQFAYDFNLPEGSTFHAARAGRVSDVVDDQPSGGGGVGNYVVIEHEDGTQGVYAHSPSGGIRVRVGDRVRPGDALGIVGRSGMAGYPHLHFVVATGKVPDTMRSEPMNFRNADPADLSLRAQTTYRALNH